MTGVEQVQKRALLPSQIGRGWRRHLPVARRGFCRQPQLHNNHKRNCDCLLPILLSYFVKNCTVRFTAHPLCIGEHRVKKPKKTGKRPQRERRPTGCGQTESGGQNPKTCKSCRFCTYDSALTILSSSRRVLACGLIPGPRPCGRDAKPVAPGPGLLPRPL